MKGLRSRASPINVWLWKANTEKSYGCFTLSFSLSDNLLMQISLSFNKKIFKQTSKHFSTRYDCMMSSTQPWTQLQRKEVSNLELFVIINFDCMDYLNTNNTTGFPRYSRGLRSQENWNPHVSNPSIYAKIRLKLYFFPLLHVLAVFPCFQVREYSKPRIAKPRIAKPRIANQRIARAACIFKSPYWLLDFWRYIRGTPSVLWVTSGFFWWVGRP